METGGFPLHQTAIRWAKRRWILCCDESGDHVGAMPVIVLRCQHDGRMSFCHLRAGEGADDDVTGLQ